MRVPHLSPLLACFALLVCVSLSVVGVCASVPLHSCVRLARPSFPFAFTLLLTLCASRVRGITVHTGYQPYWLLPCVLCTPHVMSQPAPPRGHRDPGGESTALLMTARQCSCNLSQLPQEGVAASQASRRPSVLTALTGQTGQGPRGEVVLAVPGTVGRKSYSFDGV